MDYVCDNQYGSLQSNGTWTGMVGELVAGRADIALANIGVGEERSRYVDYSAVAMSFGGAGTFIMVTFMS